MLSSLFVAVGITVAFAAQRDFTPQNPLDLPHNKNRVWVHLASKCFPTESSVHDFKDTLLSEYKCISYNDERPQIYKHSVTANYSVWSLWLEKSSNLACLSSPITLPKTVLPQCVEGVYYEPLEAVQQNQFECRWQGTSQGLDLWSLDILDGVFDDLFVYPGFADSKTGLGQNIIEGVEAIILDTLVDPNHVEFADNEVVNLFTGTPAPSATYDHGTHVAGTVVGGDTGGSKEGTPLCYYPVCQIGSSCAWSDIEGGYEAAIQRMITRNGQSDCNGNCRFVVNYSVGGSRNTMNEAAYNAWGVRMNANGGIWVTSAGNSNQITCNFAPAFSEEAISVGAYDVHTQAASFSNYGACTDTWGPGVLVWSAAPGGSYTPMSGTSMSSPNVAAMVINLLRKDNTRSLQSLKTYFNTNARMVSGGIKGTMNQAYILCDNEEMNKQ